MTAPVASTRICKDRIKILSTIVLARFRIGKFIHDDDRILLGYVRPAAEAHAP